MRVWRLCKARHATSFEQAFSGEGAGKYGGRWNPVGVYTIYASSTLSLALLETLVHADLEDLPDDLVAVSAVIPKGERRILKPEDLPSNWREIDPSPQALVEIGGKWLVSGESLTLSVPSVVIPDECNYLINPAHPEFARMSGFTVQPFQIDPRLGLDY